MTNDQVLGWVDSYGLFGAAIIVIVGILIGIGVLLYHGWGFISGVVRTVDIIADLPERLDKIDLLQMQKATDIAEIKQELTTNHGSSLKDSVYRIERQLGLRDAAPVVLVTQNS